MQEKMRAAAAHVGIHVVKTDKGYTIRHGGTDLVTDILKSYDEDQDPSYYYQNVTVLLANSAIMVNATKMSMGFDRPGTTHEGTQLFGIGKLDAGKFVKKANIEYK